MTASCPPLSRHPSSDHPLSRNRTYAQAALLLLDSKDRRAVLGIVLARPTTTLWGQAKKKSAPAYVHACHIYMQCTCAHNVYMHMCIHAPNPQTPKA